MTRPPFRNPLPALAFVLVLAALRLPIDEVQAQTGVTTGAAALVATDLSLRMLALGRDGQPTLLSAVEADAYLNQTRCRCGAPVSFRAELATSGMDKLKADSVDAEMWWGSGCDGADRTTRCLPLGEGSLGQGKIRFDHTATTDQLFKATNAAASDPCEAFEGTRALWLILNKDGKQLTLAISQAIRLDAKPPASPTLTAAQPGDGALELTWTPSATPNVRSYQALCTPGARPKFEPAFESCLSPDAEDSGGTGVFPCTARIAAGVTRTRVEGLDNGTPYKVALVAIDASGNVSAASNAREGTPGPSVGFADLYQEAAGGEPLGGCSFGGRRQGGSWAGFGIFIGLLCLRRRLQRLSCWLLAAPAITLCALVPSVCHARGWDMSLEGGASAPAMESPRTYVLSVGLGFYRPAIDHGLGTAGKPGPFEQVFSSQRRPLWQLRLERLVWQGFGSLSVGLGGGYYEAAARAFTRDRQSRSADQTSLQVIPLTFDVVYRFDPWRHRRVPIVPYGRLGLDTALWSMSDESSRRRGVTPGWHAGVGLAFSLDALDPESAGELDREAGINGTRLFVEVNHADVSGLGRSRRVNVSDTTFTVGMALEL